MTNDKHLIETHALNQQNILSNIQTPCVIWFTGLSGSGKSTLAHALQKALYEKEKASFILDGDNIRKGINNDLGFSDDDRTENIRRISEISKLFARAGFITISAFISPFIKDREFARQLVDPFKFIEIHVSCPLHECEKRDPKGLYKKARANIIPEFTGISSPYETPKSPELSIDTSQHSIDDCVSLIIDYLKEQQLLESKGDQ